MCVEWITTWVDTFRTRLRLLPWVQRSLALGVTHFGSGCDTVRPWFRHISAWAHFGPGSNSFRPWVRHILAQGSTRLGPLFDIFRPCVRHIWPLCQKLIRPILAKGSWYFTNNPPNVYLIKYLHVFPGRVKHNDNVSSHQKCHSW